MALYRAETFDHSVDKTDPQVNPYGIKEVNASTDAEAHKKLNDALPKYVEVTELMNNG